MKVIFTKSYKIMSGVIRAIYDSDYSHCGIVIGDYVIEAIPFKGVVKTPLSQFSKYALVEYPTKYCNKGIDAAINQLHKKYSYRSAIGFRFERTNSTDKWSCAELVSYCLNQAGLEVLRDDKHTRYLPRDLWLSPYVKIIEER